MIRAPLVKSDPRFLGVGSSKAIWIKVPNAVRVPHPREDSVVVNSLEEQRTFFGTTDKDIQKYYKHLENEFHFTRYLKMLFPHLIPKVEESSGILPVGPFRYIKERCYPLPKNADLFYVMIRISDAFNYLGWAYLDMKPDNVGVRGKKIMLLDTDPYCFYRIPEESRLFYHISCHMIILLFCLNHIPEIPHAVLRAFIHARGYSHETFSNTYKMAEEYDRNFFVKANDLIKLNKKYMVNEGLIKMPKEFFDAYGNKEGETALERLDTLLKEPIEPFQVKRLMNFPSDLTIDPKKVFSLQNPMGIDSIGKGSMSIDLMENLPTNLEENDLKGPKTSSKIPKGSRV